MATDLSICIPVYEQTVEDLTRELHEQAQAENLSFEILLWDDGSGEAIRQVNRPLAEWSAVRYHELKSNVGRSKIRNLLMEAAAGDYLLFLDNDSAIPHNGFIKKYWQAKMEEGVCCGGTSYKNGRLDSKLHFKYASTREVKSLSQRKTSAHRGFHSNNFLIAREVTLSVRFDERLRQYGHEDTLFGLDLARKNIPIRHIHNPVEHRQLENNVEFLHKTKLGLQNLAYLYHKRPDLDLGFFPLLQRAVKLKKWGLAPAYLAFYKLLHKTFKKNLKSAFPSLRVFDLYRLGYLIIQLKEKDL